MITSNIRYDSPLPIITLHNMIPMNHDSSYMKLLTFFIAHNSLIYLASEAAAR